MIIWLLCLGLLPCFSEGRKVFNLASTLKWYPSQESRRPGGNALASKIVLTLKFKNNVQLNLVRENDNIQDVQVFAKLKLKRDYLDKAALYMDRANHAVFSVGVHNSQVTYYGEFVYNNVVWSLMPFIGFISEYLGSKSKTYVTSLNGTQHFLQKDRPRVGQTTGDDAGKQPKLNRNDSLVNKVDNEARKLLPTTVDGKQLYTIQVLVILDYSVYTKWLHNAGGDRDGTIRNLKQYYAHVINGVKERYEGVNIPGLKYTASLSGIHILTSLKEADFIESTKARNGAGLNTLLTMERMKDWVQSKRTTFPEFDVAAVFTHYALLPNYNGYAFIGAACTTRGVSINRDLGSFDTILTVSHEIGHNLGAYHDSDGNNCKHEDQYVMAKGRLHDKGRLFTFSSCSLYYFQKFNRYLISKSMMCLNNLPETVFPKDVGQYLNQHPGQKLTLDEQCRAVHGRNSYFCGGGNEETICMRMTCLNPHNLCQETAAAEGTSCANRKWCHRGGCVPDDRAPAMKTCAFGDFKAVIDYSGYRYNCTQLIKYYPSLCYQEYYKSKCCESCDKLRKQKPKDCPYGDLHAACVTNLCSTPSYSKDCCETCKSVKFDSHGKLLEVCDNERFDRRCQSVATDSMQCYHVGKLCCKVCAQYKTDISGCEYGDKAPWCEGHIRTRPSNCKSSKATCCKSCINY